MKLAKPDGGHRLIGLLHSIYRIWGRLRRWVSADWEEQHQRDMLASCLSAIAPSGEHDYMPEHDPYMEELAGTNWSRWELLMDSSSSG